MATKITKRSAPPPRDTANRASVEALVTAVNELTGAVGANAQRAVRVCELIDAGVMEYDASGAMIMSGSFKPPGGRDGFYRSDGVFTNWLDGDLSVTGSFTAGASGITSLGSASVGGDIYALGSITSVSEVVSGATFRSVSADAYLASAGGAVFLRPSGVSNTDNQFYVYSADGSAYAFTNYVAGRNGGEAQFRRFADSVYFVVNAARAGIYDSGIPAWIQVVERATNVTTFRGPVEGRSMRPTTNNIDSCGAASQRWSVVYAGTGTINTSDAREKTPVQALTSGELDAAAQLCDEIGTYQWLEMIDLKGAAARHHVGMTVQRAMEVMVSNGLDPSRYGFICYDEWDETPPVVEERAEQPPQLDLEGNEVAPGIPAGSYVVQPSRPAGNRYSFRMDELAMFLAAGAAHRQKQLLARIESLENEDGDGTE